MSIWNSWMAVEEEYIKNGQLQLIVMLIVLSAVLYDEQRDHHGAIFLVATERKHFIWVI